jgi:hypothetical protein
MLRVLTLLYGRIVTMLNLVQDIVAKFARLNRVLFLYVRVEVVGNAGFEVVSGFHKVAN